MPGRLSASCIRSAAALATVAAAVLAPSVSAQLDPKGTGNCRVGGTVSLRDGRTGTVVRAEGNSCHVRLSDGTEEYALQWMLTPVRGGAAGGGAAKSSPARPVGKGVVPGTYQCYGGPAGNMRVKLTGPRYGEAYAIPLPDGRVGLSGRPTGPFYMTCERR